MSVSWNPWHGCIKISEGCENCYVYRIDGKHQRDSSKVCRNSDFDLPVRLSKKGGYKIPSGEMVYTCFSSDFFLDDADEWRLEAWEYIRQRPDLNFIIFTKRIHRFSVSLPDDWGDGYGNVTIGCTCENSARAEYRLPIFLSLPIKHKMIICEPLLSAIDLAPFLCDKIESVYAGGESGENARVCDYEWVMGIRDACASAKVDFHYHQTGANLMKNGRLYKIPRSKQFVQAEKAGIDLFFQSSGNRQIYQPI